MDKIKVFVSGSKSITDLTKLEQLTLDRFINKKVLFLIGDCYGIDRAVQQYLFDKGYTDVVIYATDGKVRNNVGSYPVKAIPSNGYTGYQFYRQKDIAMINDCDQAVLIWDGKSKGTKQNAMDLGKLRKRITMFDPTID